PYTRNERDLRDEENYRYHRDAGGSTPPMHHDAGSYREQSHYENKHRLVPEAIIAWASALNTGPAAEVVLRLEAEAEAEGGEEEEDHMAKEAYGGIGVDPKSGWLTTDAIQLMKALTMDFPLQLTAATSSMEMNTPMVR
ncbi:hypothetical protein GGI22_006600, partial [Coemansia erecta]